MDMKKKNALTDAQLNQLSRDQLVAAFVKTVVGLRSKLFNHSGIKLFVRQLHPATRNLFHGLVDDEPLGV